MHISTPPSCILLSSLSWRLSSRTPTKATFSCTSGNPPPCPGVMYPPLMLPQTCPTLAFPTLSKRGVLSAPPSLTHQPKVDNASSGTNKKKSTATISAKPQVTNPRAQVTWFVPTALRVHPDNEGVTAVPQRRSEDDSAVPVVKAAPKSIPSVPISVQMKDDVCEVFMKETEGLLGQSCARTGFYSEHWCVEQEPLFKLMKSNIHCQVFSKSSSRNLLTFALLGFPYGVFLYNSPGVKPCC